VYCWEGSDNDTGTFNPVDNRPRHVDVPTVEPIEKWINRPKLLLARRKILEEEYGQTYYVSGPPPSVSLFGAVFRLSSPRNLGFLLWKTSVL
jgi:hypothetical protein